MILYTREPQDNYIFALLFICILLNYTITLIQNVKLNFSSVQRTKEVMQIIQN